MDPQSTATGQKARDIIMQTAALKVAIDMDILNVCTGSGMGSRIWTQIVENKRHPVMTQLDGRMEIELDSANEEDGSTEGKVYISTRDNNMEVRCVLNEATEFSPREIAANNATSRRSQIVSYAL